MQRSTGKCNVFGLICFMFIHCLWRLIHKDASQKVKDSLQVQEIQKHILSRDENKTKRAAATIRSLEVITDFRLTCRLVYFPDKLIKAL